MSVSYILLPLEILLVVIQSSASKYSSCWLNTEGQSWGLLRVKSMCEPLAQTSSFISGLCTSIVICLGGNFVLNSCFRKSIRLAWISFLRVGFIPVLLGQLAPPCCDRLSGEHRTAPYLQGSGEDVVAITGLPAWQGAATVETQREVPSPLCFQD